MSVALVLIGVVLFITGIIIAVVEPSAAWVAWPFVLGGLLAGGSGAAILVKGG